MRLPSEELNARNYETPAAKVNRATMPASPAEIADKKRVDWASFDLHAYLSPHRISRNDSASAPHTAISVTISAIRLQNSYS